MQLISVNSAKRTAFDGLLELVITADIDDGAGEQTLPFAFSPTDQFGLGPAVASYLADNPDFPIGPYVAPPVTEPVPPSDQELVAEFQSVTAKLKARGLL